MFKSNGLTRNGVHEATGDGVFSRWTVQGKNRLCNIILASQPWQVDVRFRHLKTQAGRRQVAVIDAGLWKCSLEMLIWNCSAQKHRGVFASVSRSKPLSHVRQMSQRANEWDFGM